MKSKLNYLLSFLFMICYINSRSQTTIFSDNFESYGANFTLTNATAGWRVAQFTGSNNRWEVNNAAACRIAGNRSLMITNNGTTCTYKKTDDCDKIAYNATAINTTGYSCLNLIFDYKINGEVVGNTVYDYMNPYYSLDGLTWFALPQFYYSQTTTATATIPLPSACDNQTTLYIGFDWVNDFTGGNDVPAIIDNVVVNGFLAAGSPGNNNCINATAMTFTGTTASISGDNSCATADNVAPSCYNNNRNVWHTFVPSTSGNYYISVLGGTLTNPTFAAYRYTTACNAGTATQVSCGVYSSSGYVSASACSLVAGQTYYVSVDTYGGSIGTYTLSVTGSISNDQLSTPANIASCGTNFNSSTIFATNCGDGGTFGQNVDNNAATGGFGAGADVGFSVENSSWYNFCNGNASTSSFTVTMTNSGGCTGPYGVQLAAFTGSTSALTLVSGGTNGMDILPAASFTTSAISLATGACAYIMVDGFAGTNCNYFLSVAASPACTLLPIDLLYFDAYRSDNQNIIKWATNTELNCDKFIVEKSNDGINYEVLATIKGSGNSSIRINYETIDDNPFNNGTYYHLKQIDYSGAFKFTNSIFIDNNKSYDKFEIINLKPNPADNSSVIRFSIPYRGDLTIEIYDSFGNKIQEKEFTAGSGITEDIINLEKLNVGVYFIRATFDNTITKTISIIKTNNN